MGEVDVSLFQPKKVVGYDLDLSGGALLRFVSANGSRVNVFVEGHEVDEFVESVKSALAAMKGGEE